MCMTFIHRIKNPEQQICLIEMVRIKYIIKMLKVE